MIPSLKGWPTKAKEAPSPREVRMSPLDTNPVFQSVRGSGIFIVTPTLEGLPTKDKEAPSPDEVRLALLDINPVFQSLGDKAKKAYLNSSNLNLPFDGLCLCLILSYATILP